MENLTTIKPPVSDKFAAIKSMGYPEERKPIPYTGIPEKKANLLKFTKFYFDNRIDQITGKTTNIFKLIVAYNDKMKPEVPYWPKESVCLQLNRKLRDQLNDRLDRIEGEGVVVVRPSSAANRFHKKKPTVDGEVVGKRTLDERVESLAEDLIDSAQDELNMANDGADEPAIAMKRKAHAVGVFAYISRHVHKKKELDIKTKASQIGEATFLMDLMGRATAGKLDEEQLKHLESAVSDDPIQD